MPDVDTEDIVSSLVEVSRQAFEDYYTVDTKRITDIPQISIDTARNMLLVMEKYLKTMSVKEFNDSLCIVYEVLPRRIDNLWKLVARKPEDFQAIIRRETDAINLMEEKIAEARKGIVSSAKETICDAHGIEMRPVTAEKKPRSWTCSMEMLAAGILTIIATVIREHGRSQTWKQEKV